MTTDYGRMGTFFFGAGVGLVLGAFAGIEIPSPYQYLMIAIGVGFMALGYWAETNISSLCPNCSSLLRASGEGDP